MNHTQMNVSINRKHKDRLFHMIFGDDKKKNSLSLYNALHGTNYTDEGSIEITTIEDALYIKMKNDVSILIDSYLSLWEQQSTFNPNMPIRGLMYFGNLYNSYIDKWELPIYGSTLVKIPTPKYIVFYNGETKRESVEKLKLSDAFIHKDENHEFEWTATMINLNQGKNEELLSKCKPLSDYMILVDKIKQYKTLEATLQDAVERAIDECIKEDVLADFLRKQRGDVMLTCLTEFGEVLYKKGLLEEGRELGIAEGRELGIAEGRELGISEGRELGISEGRELGISEGRELGISEGRVQTSIETARNLFENGVDFEVVRVSVEHLTDEQLKAIYDEVSDIRNQK